MEEKEFNLLTEPWIRVMRDDCVLEEISLSNALIQAHVYRQLAGELPTQNTAVLRLLLAVLHVVFEGTGADGEESRIESADDAYDRWSALWENKRFPAEPLLSYFDTQKENFWLFHPTKPFWQAPYIKENTRTQSEPIRKINGAISESGNKIRLFAERNGQLKDDMSCAEAARWLVNMNQYDDNTMKTGLGVGWLGQFAAITARGRNLFETLMLNLVFLDPNEEVWDSGKVSWEEPWKENESVRKIALPHDPAAILSAHSRYGRFERIDGKLSRYVSAKGGLCFEAVTRDEQMALWHRDRKTDSYVLTRSLYGKQLWREFSSVIADPDSLSGLVVWHSRLIRAGCLSKNTMMHYEVVEISYDKSQHSSVENIYQDSLQLYADLLTEIGKSIRDRIIAEIARCDQIAGFIGRLANDLFFASGGDVEKKSLPASSAREQYYYRIDVPFRQWLSELDAQEQDMDAKVTFWRKAVDKTAFDFAEKMVLDAGPAAFIGKTVKKSKDDPGMYYSSPSAMQQFRYNMKQI